MKKLGFGLMRLPLINGEFDCIDKKQPEVQSRLTRLRNQ